MDVLPMSKKISFIANALIRESTLPDFAFPSDLGAQSMGIRAFDVLNRAFKCYVSGRGEQNMNVVGHHDE